MLLAGCNRSHQLPPYVSDVDGGGLTDAGPSPLPDQVCVPGAPLIRVHEVGGCARLRGRTSGPGGPEGACGDIDLGLTHLARIPLNLLGPIGSRRLVVTIALTEGTPGQICTFHNATLRACGNCPVGCFTRELHEQDVLLDGRGYAPLTIGMPPDTDFEIEVCAPTEE